MEEIDDPRLRLEVDCLELDLAANAGYMGYVSAYKSPRDIWKRQIVPTANECEAEGSLSSKEKLTMLADTAGKVAQTLSRSLRGLSHERAYDARWFSRQAKRFTRKLGELSIQ